MDCGPTECDQKELCDLQVTTLQRSSSLFTFSFLSPLPLGWRLDVLFNHMASNPLKDGQAPGQREPGPLDGLQKRSCLSSLDLLPNSGLLHETERNHLSCCDSGSFCYSSLAYALIHHISSKGGKMKDRQKNLYHDSRKTGRTHFFVEMKTSAISSPLLQLTWPKFSVPEH